MSSSALLGEPMMQTATISLRLVRSPACSASSTSWSRRALIGTGRLSPTGRSGQRGSGVWGGIPRQPQWVLCSCTPTALALPFLSPRFPRLRLEIVLSNDLS